jgi:hypothetical protein
MKKPTCLIYVCLLLLVLVGCGNDIKVKSGEAGDDYIAIWSNTAFSRQGIAMMGNGPLRFADAGTGVTAVLCDKPDCRHVPASSNNPDPVCLAQFRQQLNTFAIYRGRQLIICGVEGSPLSQEIYTADINGRNRKRITLIPDITSFVETVIVRDNMLLFSYNNKYKLDENGLLEGMDDTRSGIVSIDLESGQTEVIFEKTAYNTNIWKLYIKDNAVYFGYSEMNAETDKDHFEDLWQQLIDNGEYEQLEAYISKHTISNLYRYDLATREETLVWQSHGEKYICSFADGYALARPHYDYTAVYLVSLSDGSESLLAKTGAGSGVGEFTNDSELFYYIGTDSLQKWYQYDFEANQSVALFEADTLVDVFYILPDIVYVAAIDENGEYYYGCISKEDFLGGSFGAVRILYYPTREWRY